MAQTLDPLALKFMELFECDSARIAKYSDNMYLVIGFARNTKDDPGQIHVNGDPIDFDYLQEKAIASGKTEDALIDDALKYHRLCGMTMQDYLDEVIHSRIGSA